MFYVFCARVYLCFVATDSHQVEFENFSFLIILCYFVNFSVTGAFFQTKLKSLMKFDICLCLFIFRIEAKQEYFGILLLYLNIEILVIFS